MADEIENNENSEEQETGQESPQDERLEKRKKKTESKRQQALVKTALILGILIIINIISVKLFYRLDLTGNKIYTLSKASKDIVGTLDDKMVVKAYFTDNLPAPYNNTRRYLKETLDDYRNYSKGNLQYEIVSPSDETELEKERYPVKFEINMLRCIFCGFCEEVCPEEAIVMSDEYILTFTSQDQAIFGKDKLLMSENRLRKRLDFLHQNV